MTPKALSREDIIKVLNEQAKEGWVMEKMTHNATRTLFSYTPATYDRRTVYSVEEAERLSRKGFQLTSDAGWIAFGALLALKDIN